MKNMIITSVLFIASVLSIVVVADEQDQSLSQAIQPNLVIYRAVDRSAISYRILVDGKRVGKLTKHAVIGLRLEEGEHVVSTSASQHTALKVVVAEGGVTYISGDIDKKHRLSFKQVEPAVDAVAAMVPDMTMVQIN
jgi:hypothetical protein